MSEYLRNDSDVCPFLAAREESKVKPVHDVNVLYQYHVHVWFERWHKNDWLAGFREQSLNLLQLRIIDYDLLIDPFEQGVKNEEDRSNRRRVDLGA